MATLKCNTHLRFTTDVMLPFLWHQGQDPWSINAATSRAETSDFTQVHPGPPLPIICCLTEFMMKMYHRQLRVQSLMRLHSRPADETLSSLFRPRMVIFSSISTHASSDMRVQGVREVRNSIRPCPLSARKASAHSSHYQVSANTPLCLFSPALTPPVLLAQVARCGGAREAETGDS